MNTDRKIITTILAVTKAISNKTRLAILFSLYEKPKTWTELLFELRINPKSLRDQLQFLRDRKLVRKRMPVGFELTKTGRSVLELSAGEIFRLAKEASEEPRTIQGE